MLFKSMVLAMLFSVNVYGYEYGQEYLEVPSDEIYSEVFGDGYEAGFKFDLLSMTTKIEIFNSDPHVCELNVSAPKIVIIDGVYKIRFEVSVQTSVGADTGGCLISITDSSGETLRGIDYQYTTDY